MNKKSGEFLGQSFLKKFYRLIHTDTEINFSQNYKITKPKFINNLYCDAELCTIRYSNIKRICNRPQFGVKSMPGTGEFSKLWAK